MNSANYVVFDFETDGVDTSTCQVLQVAALVLNPRTLKPIEGARFDSYMKPDFEKLDLSALEINKINIDTLKSAPSNKVVWKMFAKFCQQYNVVEDKATKKPIPVGYNIQNFDLAITNRLNDEFKQKSFFSRFSMDVMDLAFMWFENNNVVDNLKFDSLRNLFGFSHENAHNAITDVEQTAIIFEKFILLNRNISKYVKWEK